MLGLIGIFSVTYLLLNRQRHAAIFLAGAVISGVALLTLFKLAIDRLRPDIESAIRVFTLSFSSDHATVSVVVFLTLGAPMAHVTRRPPLCGVLSRRSDHLHASPGLSRIYLVVHYPTDVAGSWALGPA